MNGSTVGSHRPSNQQLLYDGRTAGTRLNVVVVGCGIGGLACAFSLQQAGHKVTILETARNIGEIGAGIQVTPNLSRILIKWGLKERLRTLAVIPEAIVFRRYSTGEMVGYSTWGAKMERDHGSPYCHVHRADLHRMIHELAEQAGVTIRLSSHVQSIDPSKPTLTLSSGEVIRCDLIVGADGVKSMIREVVVGGPDRPRPTGDAAYRAIIPAEKMRKDPELRALLDHPEMTAWMGPDRHAMGYCIRGRQEYNLVLPHPDGRNGMSSSIESWTAAGNVEDMRKEFSGWEPRIVKMLQLIPSTLKWMLADRDPLETWVHKDGKVTLLGDACHPMLPYRAQGAAMAVEDAVVLGGLLSRLRTPADLPRLLKAYQQLRLPRTSESQLSARLNQTIFHLSDGPAQEARDADMRQAMEWDLARQKKARDILEGKATAQPSTMEDDVTWQGNMNQWADQTKNKSQFGYDAYAAADNWWNSTGKKEMLNS